MLQKTTQSIESTPSPLVSSTCDVAQYEQEVGLARSLSQVEESELGRSITRDRCPVARAQLLRANLRLVPPIAKRFEKRGVPIRSLIEEGNIGLAWAVEEFDPDSGMRFSTFASWWIKHAIRRRAIGEPREVQSIAS